MEINSFSGRSERWQQLERARVLSEINRHREAAHILHGLLSRNPEDVQVLCSLSATYLNLKEMKQALLYADQAITAAPDEEWGHRLRSIVLLKIDKVSALIAARQAVEIQPEAHRTLITLINALIANHRLGEAKTVAEKLHTLAPDSPDTYETLASLAFARKWWHDSEQFSREALKRDAGRYRSHYNLGAALYNAHRYEESVKSFVEASRLDPMNPDARKMVDQSVGEVLTGRGPNYFPLANPSMLIFFAPLMWIVALGVLQDARQGKTDWQSVWMIFGLAVVASLLNAYFLWKRHRCWCRLSVDARRIYLIQRWGWLRRMVPDWFDRTFLPKGDR